MDPNKFFWIFVETDVFHSIVKTIFIVNVTLLRYGIVLFFLLNGAVEIIENRNVM